MRNTSNLKAYILNGYADICICICVYVYVCVYLCVCIYVCVCEESLGENSIQPKPFIKTQMPP